ncbi:MAG: hypothetical protein BM562_14180 [Alphaproteobacteria bacterium MedPE-SWcel]|nr:MAG: hypothetical protein BM562_14180 [Alphaproteobacteria bacterium MedPE-SWcel]
MARALWSWSCRQNPDRVHGLADTFLAGFHPVREWIVHDAEVGNGLDLPLRGRVWARPSFAGVWVAIIDEPVPDQAANVEVIVQDAGAALDVP